MYDVYHSHACIPLSTTLFSLLEEDYGNFYNPGTVLGIVIQEQLLTLFPRTCSWSSSPGAVPDVASQELVQALFIGNSTLH